MAPKSQHANANDNSAEIISTDTDGEIAVIGKSGVAIKTPSVIDRFASTMRARAKLDESMADKGAGMEAVMARNLQAETIEDLWDADEGGTPSAEDFADVEHRIDSFDVLSSKNEEYDTKRLGDSFLLVHGTRLDNGEEIIYNTSAALLVTKLMGFERLNALPVDVVIRATALEGVKKVLKYRPVPKRAISG